MREGEVLVVGIGQEKAGDDGVGLLVARAVAARGVSALESVDASVLVDLLAEGRRLVVVDAVLDVGKPGDVLHLQPDDLARGQTLVSSHGLGVAEALALARVLWGASSLGRIDIVGVVIDGEPVMGSVVSSAVVAAVERAAALAVRLASPRR